MMRAPIDKCFDLRPTKGLVLILKIIGSAHQLLLVKIFSLEIWKKTIKIQTRSTIGLEWCGENKTTKTPQDFRPSKRFKKDSWLRQWFSSESIWSLLKKPKLIEKPQRTFCKPGRTFWAKLKLRIKTSNSLTLSFVIQRTLWLIYFCTFTQFKDGYMQL